MLMVSGCLVHLFCLLFSAGLWGFYNMLCRQYYYYFNKEYARVLQLSELMEPLEQAGRGTIASVMTYFFQALALLADFHHPDSPNPTIISQSASLLSFVPVSSDSLSTVFPTPAASSDPAGLLRRWLEVEQRVNVIQSKMKCWSEYGACNFQHKMELIEAEKLRCMAIVYQRQDFIHATLQLYDQAIEHAGVTACSPEQALSAELTGRYYCSIGRPADGVRYIRKAAAWYRRWQCTFKTRQLLHDFPSIRSSSRVVPTSPLPHNYSRYTTAATTLNDQEEDEQQQHTNKASRTNNNFKQPQLPHISDDSQSEATTASTTSHPMESDDPGLSSRLAALDLDISTVIRASQSLSVETDLTLLFKKLMTIVMQHAGATRGVLVVHNKQLTQPDYQASTSSASTSAPAPLTDWSVRLTAAVSHVGPQSLVPPYSSPSLLDDTVINTSGGGIQIETEPTDPSVANAMPMSVFNYVLSTQEPVLLYDADLRSGSFSTDVYFNSHNPRACMCLPIIHTSVIGLLYLENDCTGSAFRPAHLQVLQLLCSQASLAMENAR